MNMGMIVVTTIICLTIKDKSIAMGDGTMMISLFKKCAVLALLICTLFVQIKIMGPLIGMVMLVMFTQIIHHIAVDMTTMISHRSKCAALVMEVII